MWHGHDFLPTQTVFANAEAAACVSRLQVLLPILISRIATANRVILVLDQYKRIVCSLGKHPDTRTMVTVLDDDSRDNVHGRCLCIAV